MTVAPVTLVIPTCEGGAVFKRALEVISRLDPAPTELVVIDSGSTDGSDRSAEASGATLVRVSRSEFNHGETRMMAVRQAKTPLVAFMSQDVLPDPGYLGPLVKALENPAVAGASARILPPEDASFFARRTVLSSPMSSADPVTTSVDAAQLEGMTRDDLRRIVRFDNVASIARRDLLLECPFPRTMMGEDVAWAMAVLEKGYHLRFESQSVVWHAHQYNPVSAFCRYRDDASWIRRAYGERLRSSLLDVMRGLAFEVREDFRALGGESLATRLVALPYSPLLRGGQVLGQWWGSNVGGKE